MSNSDEWGNATEANAQSNETWDSTSTTPLIGKYIGMKTNVGPNQSNLYNIQNEEDGEIWGVWGSAVIDSKFAEIPLHSRVRIEYLGKKDGKRGQFKDYSVKYKAPEAAANPANSGQTATQAPTVPVPPAMGEGEAEDVTNEIDMPFGNDPKAV